MPKVTIDINAKDNASTILRKVNTSIGELNSTTTKSSGISMASATAYGVTAAAMYKLGSASLQAYGQMEQNTVAFNTMLGSAEKANDLLKDMTNFAANTPFQLPEIVTAGKQMISFGFQSTEVISNLKMLGDVSAGLSVPLGDMTYLFGQIKTQGRAMTQDLMQFANRGIPIYDELAKVLGVGTNQIKEYASSGRIGFKEINQAFKNMTGEGSKFGGLMEEQSKTLLGQWSNLNDAFDESTRILGKELAPVASDLMTIASEGLKGINKMMSSELPSSITMTGSIIKDLKNVMNGTADAVEAIGEGIGDIESQRILNDVRMWEATSTGVSAKVEELNQKYGKVNASAGIYSEYVKGHIKLTDEQVKNLEAILGQYTHIGAKAKEEMDSWAQRGMVEVKVKKTEETDEGKKIPVNDKGWANKEKAAQDYYNELVYQQKLALSSEEDQITLELEKNKALLDTKVKYLNEYQYAHAQAILNDNAQTERDKKDIESHAEAFKAMSDIQLEFYTQSASTEANAIAEMSQSVTENFKQVASDVSSILNSIASDSRKSGLSMGDGFKAGASVAVAALQSISAVMQMQQQMAQANYDRQSEMLASLQEAELEALNAKYEAEQEAIDAKYEEDETTAEDEEAARLAELEAYRLSLRGKTDAEIEAALAKKKLELKSAADSKALSEQKAAEEAALEKKKAAEEAQIKKDYAMQEWIVDVQAFKSKQDYDKKAVIMATAIGVVQAWASAMAVPFPGNVIIGAALTALMVGTAAAQLGQISSQSPPAPPSFAAGVTNFEGGLAVVGERGRELVNLPAGSNVITNENTEKLLSGGGSSPQYLVNNIYLNSTMIQQEIIDLRKAAAYGGY